MRTNMRETLTQVIERFVADESGATAIEYAVIAGVVGIAMVGALTNVRISLNDGFSFVSGEFQSALQN